MIEKRESPIQELLTIRDYLRWATSRFSAAGIYYGHGTDNAWDEAVQLIMPSLHLPWDSPPDLLNARLTLDERRHLVSVVERRIDERIPAPYITGKAWFAGLEFFVDERVLVPRSPLAELLDQEFQPWLSQYPHRILDLCTGSGCIGIACATVFNDAEVTLSDISPDAIEVANRNIEFHHLSDQVRAVESDLFDALRGQVFDLIVSNPPYVNLEDLTEMPAEFQAEPALALGSGDDGLDFTRRLLKEARQHLSDEGVMIVEIGNSWPSLEAAFPTVPFTWLEFEHGGHGVFALTAQQLDQYRDEFQ
ncbi:MAG: 50S ribosomal protein L3 N(5)-glutamine methyltransferase [Cellvibrionaceae bacterium]